MHDHTHREADIWTEMKWQIYDFHLKQQHINNLSYHNSKTTATEHRTYKVNNMK